MDLALYARVLWRFRPLIAGGIVLAVLLAILSVGTPTLRGGSVKLDYRQDEGWTSTSTIWVTQAGFPLGRSIYDQYIQTGQLKDTPVSKFSDPQRFSGLATVFAALVSSDGVRNIMLRNGPINGFVGASQPTLPGNASIVLPFLDISATSTTPAGAKSLSTRASRGLIAYVKDEQDANRIADDKRVVLQVVRTAEPAVLSLPRSKTRPIVVLLATLMVVIGLAFLLENLRPRVRPVASESQSPPASAVSGRLSA